MPGKYIVTGGCGFIGSNLVKKLVDDGNEVVVVDNLSTGSLDNIKDSNGEKVRVLKSIDELCGLEDSDGFDGIFHFGMPSSTPIYRDDRGLIGKTATDTVTLWEFAKDRKIKIVYASSSSMYNKQEPPFKEEMPVIPTDFYTEVRLFVERLARVYYEFYGVKSVGLRLFSVYGENEKSKKNFANLISQIEWARDNGETFEVYNEGKATRDFTHVSDTIEAFMLAMKSDLDYDIINIGTGVSHTINQIMEAVGLKDFKYVGNPIKNYVADTLADTSKAEKILEFRAKVDVMEYISKRRKNVGSG
ncbi:NAD-dependent epimerase/dehydratase family protein [Candidatus Aenigmatarchaeota archaeon]